MNKSGDLMCSSRLGSTLLPWALFAGVLLAGNRQHCTVVLLLRYLLSFTHVSTRENQSDLSDSNSSVNSKKVLTVYTATDLSFLSSYLCRGVLHILLETA